MTDARMRSPSTARNRDPILAVLKDALPANAKVLEIASGAGEHAVYFAKAMPGLDWHPSDPDAQARASIAAWIDAEGVTNVRWPRHIDARTREWGVEDEAPFDAIVSCNMAHISPWESTLGLLDGAKRLLKPGGVLFLYGPFMRSRQHTAPSNAAFDASLKARDPSWGVRDMSDIDHEAASRDLRLLDIIDMPANNFCLLWRR